MLRARDLTFYPYLTLPNPASLWQQMPLAGDAVKTQAQDTRWVWAPLVWPLLEGALDTIDALTASNWERIPGDYLTRTGPQLFHLFGQLGHLLGVQMPGQSKPQLWAPSVVLRSTTEHPVILGFVRETLPAAAAEVVFTGDEHDEDAISPGVLRVLGVLPPQEMGTIGLVYVEKIPTTDSAGWKYYSLDALGKDARALQVRLGQALQELADQKRRDDPEAWLAGWEGAQHMAHDLAAAYWQAHTQGAAERGERARSLPPLTSAHQTLVPSHNAARGLLQTFGPGVQPSLWNLDPTARTIELQTPNRSLVSVTAQEGPELPILHRHVNEGLTPEGVKHALGVIAAYADQTGGVDQKVDARVALRQLLLRMGKPESHADDPEEQRRLYHTILYLARCMVHASDRPEDPRPPGSARRRKGREFREYSPMLVIERVQFEHDGTLRIPREVTFHLGADYYHLLFGQGRSYFTIPTALVLSYHPDREQHELLLAMYLSDMLAWNSNPWRVGFHPLVLQSALRSEDDLAHGHDRLRDATRVLLALEHLERDGLLLRAEHQDVDTALACELALGNIAADVLSEATRQRLAQAPYRTLTAPAVPPAQLADRRRIALQRLLKGTASSLELSAGPLLREQVERRAAKRKEVAERDERAITARVVKNATQKIVDAAQDEGNPPGAKGGAKRRGRPRKY